MDRDDFFDVAVKLGAIAPGVSQAAVRYARRFAAERGTGKRKGAKAANKGAVRKETVSAQVKHINRYFAAKKDFEIHIEDRAKIKGQGRWKKDLPDQILRDAFADPSMCMRSIAKTRKPPASSRHITDSKFMICFELRSILHSFFAGELSRELAFVILQVCLDESEYGVLVGKGKRVNNRSTDVSVVASHGRVALADATLTVTEDELPMRPAMVESNSAACLWASIKQDLPPPLWEVFIGRLPPRCKMGAVIIGSDHHSAMLMLEARVENLAPENVLALAGLCSQHDTGTCLERLVKKLGILTAGFCIAKKSRNHKFWAGIKKGIKEALVAGRMTLVPHGTAFEVRPDTRKYAEQLLELAYYKRDLRSASDPDDVGNDSKEDLRRQRGAELLRRCPGDWRSEQVTFVDYDGACPTSELAAEKLLEILDDVCLAVLGEPAQNKWLSVWHSYVFKHICILHIQSSQSSSHRRALLTYSIRAANSSHVLNNCSHNMSILLTASVYHLALGIAFPWSLRCRLQEGLRTRCGRCGR